MIGRDPVPSYPRQVWFVIIMALALVALIVSIALGKAPGIPRRTAHGPTVTSTLQGTRPIATGDGPDSEPTSTIAPTNTLPPIPQPTSTPLPSKTMTPTVAKPTATATNVPTITATATESLPEDHYWLERPISPKAHDRVARFYPYASRADGSYPIHHGVEFVNPMGTPILATAPGTIVVAGDDLKQVYGARTNFYGLLVIEELEQRFDGRPVYVLYGHLSEVKVEVGQKVDTSDVIGLVGMTGVAEGPHLHMEVRYGENDYGTTVNPDLWVRPIEGYGSLAGLVLSPDGKPVPEIKIVLYRKDEPNKPFRGILSYPAKEVNPDPLWGESFATGDLPAGQWIVQVHHQQRLYEEPVTIEPGVTSWLTLRLAS